MKDKTTKCIKDVQIPPIFIMDDKDYIQTNKWMYGCSYISDARTIRDNYCVLKFGILKYIDFGVACRRSHKQILRYNYFGVAYNPKYL